MYLRYMIEQFYNLLNPLALSGQLSDLEDVI